MKLFWKYVYDDTTTEIFKKSKFKPLPILQGQPSKFTRASFKVLRKNFCINFEHYDLTNGKDPTVEILHDVSASSFFEDLTVGNTK